MNKKIAIFDIDGTITKVGDRKKLIENEPKNWDEFYYRCDEDEPNMPIIDLAVSLWKKYYLLFFFTGRRESCRMKTVNWMYQFMPTPLVNSSLLKMRNDFDHRSDVEVKPEYLEVLFNLGYEKKDIELIFEDRTRMVKKWRELGYTCLQVADGDY
jgi:hypothetical protein